VDTVEATRFLVESYPEVGPKYEELMRNWVLDAGGPGIYTVFGSTVGPLVFDRLVQTSEVDEAGLRRFFQVIEMLCKTGDRSVRNFVAVEVAEEVVTKPKEWLRTASRLMGPCFRRECARVEEHLRNQLR
jgi:hypothetical protein